MSYISLSNYGSTSFEKLMGHAPEILNKWNELETLFFQSQHFDGEFLEQIRRALAFNNLCQYCMEKAGPSDEDPKSVRLKEGLRLANNFAIDLTFFDTEEITRLKKYFSDAELVELLAFCSFITASQKFGASLGLQGAKHYIDEK